MPNDDFSNLPILDDIIVPGDADKAVYETSSNDHSLPWEYDDSDTTDFSSTGVHAVIATDPAEDDQALTLDPTAELQLDHDATDQIAALSATETNDDTLHHKPVQTESPAEKLNTQLTPINLLDIDTLTEEILDSVKPSLEQLLREKIEQILQNRLSRETRSD